MFLLELDANIAQLSRNLRDGLIQLTIIGQIEVDDFYGHLEGFISVHRRNPASQRFENFLDLFKWLHS